MSQKDRDEIPASRDRAIQDTAEAATQALQARLFTVDLGVSLKAADTTGQLVDLKVVGSKTPYSGRDGAEEAPLLTLPATPVMLCPWLDGPLEAAQAGVVLYVQRSTDEYIENGETDYAPADPRKQDAQDAVFLPLNARGGWDGANVRVRFPDGSGGRLVLYPDGRTELGNGIEDVVTLLSDLIPLLTSWVDDNGDAPNAATVAALNALKARIDTLKP